MLKLTVTDEPDAIADIIKNINGVNAEKGERHITFCYEDYGAESFLCQLSAALIYIIERKYKKPMIKRAARSHGRLFTEDEAEQIAEYTKNFGAQLLSSEIKDYLRENDCVSLKGLVDFRLRPYKAALLQESLTVADGMENVRLLREYIALSQSGDIINVIVNEAGGITITDESGKDITGDCISDIGATAIPEHFSFEELLLSALIIRAPSEIIIHGESNTKKKSFTGILSELFPGRTVICGGCDVCCVERGF